MARPPRRSIRARSRVARPRALASAPAKTARGPRKLSGPTAGARARTRRRIRLEPPRARSSSSSSSEWLQSLRRLRSESLSRRASPRETRLFFFPSEKRERSRERPAFRALRDRRDERDRGERAPERRVRGAELQERVAPSARAPRARERRRRRRHLARAFVDDPRVCRPEPRARAGERQGRARQRVRERHAPPARPRPTHSGPRRIRFVRRLSLKSRGTAESARARGGDDEPAGASHRLTYISSTFVTCSGGTTNAETAATTPAPVRAARPPGTIRAAFAAKKSANAATPKIAPET